MYTVSNLSKLGSKDSNVVMSHMLTTGTQDVQLALTATGLLEKFQSKMTKPLREKTKSGLVNLFGAQIKQAIGLYMSLTNSNTVVITFHRKGKYVWLAGLSHSARKRLPEVASGGKLAGQVE